MDVTSDAKPISDRRRVIVFAVDGDFTLMCQIGDVSVPAFGSGLKLSKVLRELIGLGVRESEINGIKRIAVAVCDPHECASLEFDRVKAQFVRVLDRG
jgi:hypothetical protein